MVQVCCLRTFGIDICHTEAYFLSLFLFLSLSIPRSFPSASVFLGKAPVVTTEETRFPNCFDAVEEEENKKLPDVSFLAEETRLEKLFMKPCSCGGGGGGVVFGVVFAAADCSDGFCCGEVGALATDC